MKHQTFPIKGKIQNEIELCNAHTTAAGYMYPNFLDFSTLPRPSSSSVKHEP